MLILLGILINEGLSSEGVIAVALINALQVFRTASIMLFDPQLVLFGPPTYVILDNIDEASYITSTLIYPGVLC